MKLKRNSKCCDAEIFIHNASDLPRNKKHVTLSVVVHRAYIVGLGALQRNKKQELLYFLS